MIPAVGKSGAGRISISTRNQIGADGSDCLHIEVTDTGIGIDPNRLEVVVLTSLAGGTGTGRFIDICYLVLDILRMNFHRRVTRKRSRLKAFPLGLVMAAAGVDASNVTPGHVVLLPIDPDVLKRQLYNLKIEDIDDPALSFLFREKREELELQISMLNDRGTRHFFYNSLMLYNGIEDKLVEEAQQLLDEVKEEEPGEAAELLSAREFKELAEKEFEYFRGQDENFHSRIHVRDDVNILMVSQGELYIPEDYQMDANSTRALIQHEVGTHVLTYYNGLQQPLKQLSTGLTDYDTLQEGLAVLAEYLVGGLTANRMRTLAGRVVAAAARVEGKGFREIFDLLHRQRGFSAIRAFNITSRIMQGSGFIKDIIYLQGIVELKEHLEKGGELEPLLIGKFALKHLPVINELMERKVLKKTSILPRYMNTKETNERLNNIRNGLPLSKMISA